jgi:predicted patatin/cPLA2 family phospholipase
MMPTPRGKATALTVTALVTLLCACGSPGRRQPVPESATASAVILGMQNVRYYMREDLESMMSDAIAAGKRRQADDRKRGVDPATVTLNYLAVSGGSDRGAYGAGLLNGWSKAGTRPMFDLVTGVGTGALIAPFAFLGSDYDHVLEDVYTNVSPKDIYKKRNIFAALWNDAMADSKPLYALIQQKMTMDVMNAIADQYARGRWLLVATADLDSRRPVIWNMGALATYRNEKALHLFQRILLASASIPGVFPPVMIDVDMNGKQYQEMHVDGGTIAQSFLIPPSFSTAAIERGISEDQKRNAYVISNARLDPQWASVDRRTLSILARSISALYQSNGYGDLFRIYSVTQRHHMTFNLAYIPPTFDHPKEENFDTAYMRALYALGYEQAANGYQWQHVPPGFDPVGPSGAPRR